MNVRLALESILNKTNVNCAIDDEKIIRWGESSTQPTETEIQAKITELQADYDSKQYQRDRAVAYDPIPEQLDQIYHDMDGWKAKVKAVKDKYPKP
jgi:hypothetical protein